MLIQSSTSPLTRNLAILLWGPAASRKTETPLRYFPRPLVIDTEGKAQHAIGVPGVKEFLMVQTKDVYEILNVLDQLASGEILFPDGAPVETVSIDSGSVLWSVRQEAGSIMAEKRAAKRAHGGAVDPDAVTMTMLDWTRVKRPLKRLMTRLNNSPVKYIFVMAREKPLYEEIKSGQRTELKKVGETPDIQRGIEYEVDMAFRFRLTKPWTCEVTRTRGLLENIMPIGTTHQEFPASELLEYATGEGVDVQDEVAVAEEQVEKHEPKSRADLVEYGREKNLTNKDIAAALKQAGIRFNGKKWDEMTAAVDAYQK